MVHSCVASVFGSRERRGRWRSGHECAPYPSDTCRYERPRARLPLPRVLAGTKLIDNDSKVAECMLRARGLADDIGFADVGFNEFSSGKLIPTPNLDKRACVHVRVYGSGVGWWACP